jgi:hypothetical protein
MVFDSSWNRSPFTSTPEIITAEDSGSRSALSLPYRDMHTPPNKFAVIVTQEILDLTIRKYEVQDSAAQPAT